MQNNLAPLASFQQRWVAFAGKLRNRLREVMAEAEAGVHQVIAVDPLNTNAFATAQSAVTSRLLGLGERIQEAETKLGQEWDAAVDANDLAGAEAGAAWNRIVGESRGLQREVAHTKDWFEIASGAAWGRALYPLVEAEVRRPRQCARCGAAIAAASVHQASNVTCGHCGTVSTLDVGPAAGAYFSGAIHHLAREAVRDHWAAQADADRWWRDLRDPTQADRARYLDVHRAFWTAYYAVYDQLHPGLRETQTIAQAAAAKMKWMEEERW